MKEFEEIYNKVMEKSGAELEELRKESRAVYIRSLYIILPIAIILTILLKTPFILFVSLFIFILISALSGKHRKYNEAFKEKIIAPFIKEYNENLEYNPKMGMDRKTYLAGEFEGYFDRYYSEDLITGELDGNHKIIMAEVHTQNESTDSEGHTSTTTIFHGLFAQIDLNKSIEQKIKIRRNGISLFSGKERVKLDSSEFEKLFDVYSTDAITAVRLLTSDVMEMLIEFRNKNKVIPEITIKNNKLYLRFYTGSVFEASSSNDGLNKEKLQKHYNIINFTLGLTEKVIKNINDLQI